MTRHLKTCWPKAFIGERPPGVSLILFVEGRYAQGYWMHLGVPADALLSDLDRFLRQTWLECCGHLSAFTIRGERYNFGPMGWREESEEDLPLGRILEPGTPFRHEYDFGTPTELNLKVAALLDFGTDLDDIELLARNDPPNIACDRCGLRPATQICSECQWSGKGWFCESCAEAEDHKCGRDYLLPVVNSPRAGVCGYCG